MPFWTSGSQSFTDTLAAAMLVSPCWKSVKFEPRSEIELHRAVHVFLQDLACPGWGVQPVVCPMGAMLVLYPHAVWSLMVLTYVIEWRHVSFPLVINSRFQLQTSDPLKPDETWSVFPLPSTGQKPGAILDLRNLCQCHLWCLTTVRRRFTGLIRSSGCYVSTRIYIVVYFPTQPINWNPWTCQ